MCRYVNVHPPERHQEDHVRERLLGRTTRKDVYSRARTLLRARQDLNASRRKRHAMLAARFHALGGDDPEPSLKVDFAPGRSEDFAGTGGGQDEQLEGKPRGLACAARSQAFKEIRDPEVGQGRMVGVAVSLLAGLSELPRPGCRPTDVLRPSPSRERCRSSGARVAPSLAW